MGVMCGAGINPLFSTSCRADYEGAIGGIWPSLTFAVSGIWLEYAGEYHPIDRGEALSAVYHDAFSLLA